MRSKEEISQFSQSELKDILSRLDEKREKINNRFSFKKLGIAVLLVLILCIVLFVKIHGKAPYSNDKDLGVKFVAGFFLSSVFLLILLFLLRNLSMKPLRKEYLDDVLRKVITFLDPQLKYSARTGISKEEFESTGLFSRKINLSGNVQLHSASAQFEGEIKNKKFKASYVHSYKANESKSKRVGEGIITTFSGLYAIIDLNKNYPDTIIIRSRTGKDNANLGANLIGQEAYKLVTGRAVLNEVSTGVAEFDNLFSLQCNKQEALLSSYPVSLTEILLNAKKDWNIRMDLFLQGQKMHVAFYGLNLFLHNSWESYSNESSTQVFLDQSNKLLGLTEKILQQGI